MNENFDVTYKALFRRYYPSLIFYATRLVGEEEAEDVVQDVFVELWKRKDHIEIGDQIQAFLYRAVYTRALNVLKHRSVEDGYCVAMEEINQRRAEFYQPRFCLYLWWEVLSLSPLSPLLWLKKQRKQPVPVVIPYFI